MGSKARQALNRIAACALAAVLSLGLVPAPAFAQGGELVASGLFVQSLPTADYAWYVGHEGDSEYGLSSAAQLVGFANLVNGTAPSTVAAGAVSFEGKAVKLSGGTFNLMDFADGKWTPVGDAAHPFLGAFDGNGATVNNFAVNGASRAAYLGLFGYVGKTGSISNVVVGSSAKIAVDRASSSKDVVRFVGGVAGYCAGSMSNCTNNAKVTVTTAVAQTSSAHQVAYAIGGVAGECVGNMNGCTNKAGGAVTVKATSTPVAAIDDSGLVRYVGGVVGVSGDSSRIGASGSPIAADKDAHGDMDNCNNLAQVSVDTPSTSGKDRFGQTAYARSVCVGGVVGYAQGNVSECENGQLDSAFASAVGYVRCEHGSQVGGIAGSLRAAPSASNNSMGRVSGDDGSASSDPEATAVAVSRCANYGDVYALNTVGGIVGAAGSYTSVNACKNSRKNGGASYVVATRWNKPAPAGVVGTSNGDVSYCANFATVASGTWKSEAARTLNTASGYYASGLVGMLSYFTEADSKGGVKRTTPIPEVYGSYNAGSVLASSGMRQRGLVGENGGYVHDNVLLKGTVEKDLPVYDEGSIGTAVRNIVLAAADLRGKEAVKALNAMSDSCEWETYWVPSAASATKDAELNDGYPVLDIANPVAEASRSDLSGYSVSFADAPYTGGANGAAAVPEATVKDDTGNELVQGADFRVVPEPDAIEIGGDYHATVEGIGQYKGTLSGTYSIGKAKLSSCTVGVESATFDFNGHYPSASMVTVTTPGGVVVSQDEYEISKVVRRSAGKDVATYTTSSQPVDASNYYYVTVRVKSGSAHFDTSSGLTATGQYRISPADLQTDVKYSAVRIAWGGAAYAWVNSGDEVNASNPKTVLAYTGSSIKPTVSGLSYNGHALTAGKDYRIVYGNPNPLATGGESYDANNVGNVKGSAVGCITVRYQSGGNFTSYQNMFFTIRNGLAGAAVTGLSNQTYTGKALKPAPTVKVGGLTLRAGTDYVVSYANNVNVGTATVTITGKGSYGGITTATFKIVKPVVKKVKKKANPMKVKAKSPSVSYKKVKKKAQTLAASKVLSVTKAKGKLTYKKTSGSGKLTMTSKGVVKVKKGTKKGTYTIKVRVKAAGNSTYLSATKTVKVKVKVK